VCGDYLKSSEKKEFLTDWQGVEAGRGIGIDLKKIINDQWSVRLELAKPVTIFKMVMLVMMVHALVLTLFIKWKTRGFIFSRV